MGMHDGDGQTPLDVAQAAINRQFEPVRRRNDTIEGVIRLALTDPNVRSEEDAVKAFEVAMSALAAQFPGQGYEAWAKPAQGYHNPAYVEAVQRIRQTWISNHR